MTTNTGLSGNEIYCLSEKGFQPGEIVVGNSVYSLGFLGSISSGIKSMVGGEVSNITSLIEQGRETAYNRMIAEAQKAGASGVTGVSSELVFHGTNVEFLSIGSAIHAEKQSNTPIFSTCDNGQDTYAQLDLGFQPIAFSFGNVAYSVGIGRGILGTIKTIGRGEIKEFSDMFNTTRHLALERITKHAQSLNANAVLGIKTSTMPIAGCREMLMIGTASHHPRLGEGFNKQPITSSMTNIETWSLMSKGWIPLKLMLGTSVYSLGLVGGITSVLKSFARGEINELTSLIYDAREHAIGLISAEAKSIGADSVMGVRTYVYDLGNGLIEFLAIGTAVKKQTTLTPQSKQLIPQAVVADRETYYDNKSPTDMTTNVNQGKKGASTGPSMMRIVFVIIILIIAFATHINLHH